MTDRVTLFNHPSKYDQTDTSLNTCTKHIRPTTVDADHILHNKPNITTAGALSLSLSLALSHTLSLSHACKQLGLLQLARLGCFTKTTTNHKALITMQYAEAGKDMHAHSRTHSSYAQCTLTLTAKV